MNDILTCSAEHGHVWYFLGGLISGLIGRFIILVVASSGSSDSWDD